MSRRLAVLVAIVASLSLTASAQAGPSKFKDPEDGAFDVSAWLATRTGFLPVISPITEPAVGYGATVGLLFFGGGGLAGTADAPPGPSGRPVPANVSGIGGALTENGTWGGFAGYLGYWGHDRWRYAGAVARASLNLDYYGPADHPFGFNIDGWLVYQELTRRVGKTDLFGGVRYVYADSDVRFDLDELPPDVPRPEFDSKDVGLGLVAEFDTRDNTLTPGRGVDISAVGMFKGSWVGGDDNYQSYSATAKLYRDVRPRLVLAARLQAQSIVGSPPFYALPYVTMRGIQKMRYQGERVVSLDGEVRWDVYKRWWLVAFGGVGWTDGDFGPYESSQTVGAGGLGFRYLVARSLGLQMGLDVAKGPDQYAFYVVVGSSF
jgi:hypothetical protein